MNARELFLNRLCVKRDDADSHARAAMLPLPFLDGANQLADELGFVVVPDLRSLLALPRVKVEEGVGT